MKNWKISPTNKKSVEEIEIWTKDGQVVRRITVFRDGTFYVETNNDEMPDDIDPENPDSINMYDYFSDNAENGAELDSLWDGCSQEFEWPDDMPKEEQARMEALWEEDSYSAWEGEGWSSNETECWFHGPLEIEEAE
jgi:hypothetical protein